ncbi:MAG: bifunctional demethylmenaquinone methyltransferase/2-methoxy-6-polyprenyl-1,4-benzoquinol methylase UbiE [Deltaproteobacteria bacterium]|nr:bifunctional demethylmenaquinone methyltransferase/2-methoxy-6-polyprenyl-1,4-benzoquinol methylase UbiE [Deltaproteobacteria bacterium]
MSGNAAAGIDATSGDAEKRARAVREMFCSIAPRYDFLNHLLSLGIDRSWRRTMIRMAWHPEMKDILDVACGTGDVCLEIRKRSPAARIVGLDFSPGMLKLAAEKNAACGAGLELVEGSAEELPFAAGSFDLVTIAFGIRNVIDRKKALREFFRVLRPGGRVAVLEFSRPRLAWFRALYDFYFFRILPLVGGIFAKREAYRYLPDSVARFPEPEEFSTWLEEAGFRKCRWHSLTFGIATLYLGEK